MAKRKRRPQKEVGKTYLVAGASLVLILFAVILFSNVSLDNFAGKAADAVGISAVNVGVCDGVNPLHKELEMAYPDGSPKNLGRDFELLEGRCCPRGFENGCVLPSTDDPDFNAAFSGCYDEGSIISFGSSVYCSQGKWVECTNDRNAKGYLVDGLFCIDENWVPPENCGFEQLYGKAFCDGDQWLSCEDTDRLLCPTVNRVDSRFCDDEGGVVDEFYCDGENWHACDEGSHNDLSENGEYICQDEEWTRCVGGGGGVHGQTTEDGNFACEGNERQWVQCSVSGEIVASTQLCDGREFIECEEFYQRALDDQFMCENPGTQWFECNEDNLLQNNNKYVCGLEESSGDYKWLDGCNEDVKYYTRNSGEEICSGKDWLRCEYLNFLPLEDPINPNVGYTCEIHPITGGDQVIIKELNCFNGIDDDRNGFTDKDDPFCLGSPQSYTIGLGEANLFLNHPSWFELFFKNEYIKFSNIYLDSGVDFLYENMFFCDEGTGGRADAATTCAGPIDNYNPLHTIDSVRSLKNQNRRPQYLPEHSLTLIFEEGTPKKVSYIHTVIAEGNPTIIQTGNVVSNMLAGQRLMIKLGEEFYLLSYPEGEEQFRTELLQLAHIPLSVDDPNYLYQTELYPGTNQYIFNVLNNQRIAVGFDGDQFKISPLAPGEVPAAYVVPEDLAQNFELQFTQNNPIEITSPNIGVISVCRQDNPADTQQVLICDDGVEFTTLRNGELTIREIDTNGLDDNIEYVFLYEYRDGDKHISIFPLEYLRVDADGDGNLDLAVDNDGDGVLDPLIVHFNYNHFINTMIAGRRVAVEFEDQLYLLQHPLQETFSLLAMTATAYENGGTTTFEFAGSEDLVEALVLDGGFTLQRFYGRPPPPFQLTALRTDELGRIDLEKSFFTTISSQVPRRFLNPDMGVVAISDSDTALYKPTMDLTTELGFLPGLTLNFGEPRKVGNVLFYYHTAQIDGATPIKAASIHLYYDIKRVARTNEFNDDFISTFTGGREIALEFGENFYLLGHQGNIDQVQFYDPEQLTLRTLDGEETFNVEVTGEVARFEVPGGRINVQVDIANGQISFTPTFGDALLEIEEFAGFAQQLTNSNRVELSVGGQTLTFRMCFKDAYADFPSAKVCYTENGLLQSRVVSPAEIVTFDDGAGGKALYLFESNEKLGEEKIVTIREIINLEVPYFDIDWYGFVQSVMESLHPMFMVGEMLYEPFADSTRLIDFSLNEYPDGLPKFTQVKQVTDISYDGTITLGEKVVLIEQEETLDELKPVNVEFSVRDQLYLPAFGEDLVLEGLAGAETNFVITADGEEHSLEITSVTPNGILVKLNLDDLVNKYFAVGDSKRVRLDGVLVEITVEEINIDPLNPMDNNVIVTIQRK
jgi:hypothetical protein